MKESWDKIWESYDFKCMARINVLSPTNTSPVGYVGLPKEHPDYGKHYDDIDVEVHGGLTFAGYGTKIPGGPDDRLWYVGFDCMHAYDYDPFSTSSEGLPLMISNKSIEYVYEETERLVEQLARRRDR